MAGELPPPIVPVEAIRYFRQKGFTFGFAWQDVWQEEHGKAFTVAKAMSRDLLEDIRAEVDKAISEGTTLAQFRKNLQPTLVRKGWWGKALMTDPLTGEEKLVQLGSPRRLKTIFSVNVRTSYQAGRWERIQRQKASFPYLEYRTAGDSRVRAEHAAWEGTILPVDHPWWDTHYPPCGWNCRCDARPRNARYLDRKGLTVSRPRQFDKRKYVNPRTGEVTEIEQGIDPGWAYNVGKSTLSGLTARPLQGALNSGAALNALSEGDKSLLSRFFTGFGVDQATQQNGLVMRDRTGWPMAISLGLFRGSGERYVLPRGFDPEGTGRTLRDPDEIYLRWMKGKNGAPMLIRRYIRGAVVVDVGKSFWRSGRGDVAKLRKGERIWQKTGITKLVDGSFGAGNVQTRTPLGSARDNVPADLNGFARLLSAETVRKVLRDHGELGTRGDKYPVHRGDFEKIPMIIAQGQTFIKSPKNTGKPHSIRYELEIDGITHVYVEAIGRKKRLLLSKTFYKRK